MSKNIVDANEKRKSYVDALNDSLINIEKYRSKKFKAILSETYMALVEISHQLPFELEEFFEKEILVRKDSNKPGR